MFGTIGHARPRPGHEPQVQAPMEEWKQTIRPKIPGSFTSLSGRQAGGSGEMVFLALAQDEPTYRALAAMPEQDAWYRRLVEHLEGEPRWEDVEMQIDIQN